MGQRTTGDEMFEAYLSEREYAVSEHEPDLGIGVRVEFVIGRTEPDEVITEVKQFAPDAWPMKDAHAEGGTYSQKKILHPIRSSIHEGAQKLKKAKDLGNPLVVVLTDPDNAMFGLLTPTEIIPAINGDLAVQVPMSRSGPAGPTSLVTTRNGELRNEHRHVSAVVVIHRRSADEHVAHTYITNAPDAVVLDRALFRGPGDLVWEFVDGQGYQPCG
jgi:hypothetical protein